MINLHFTGANYQPAATTTATKAARRPTARGNNGHVTCSLYDLNKPSQSSQTDNAALKTKKRGLTAKGSQKLRTQTNRKQTKRVARRGTKKRGGGNRAGLARCAGEIVLSIKGLEEIEFSIYSHKLCAIPFTKTPPHNHPWPTSRIRLCRCR